MANLGEIPAGTHLKGYYKMEGNSNDSSGNGYNGTDTSITYSLANGKFGQGAGFNGTTSYVDVGTLAGFASLSEATVCFWVKPSVNNVLQCIIADWGSGSNQRFYCLILADGRLETVFYSINEVLGINGNDIIPTTDFINIIVSFKNGDYVRLYLNGQSKETSAGTATGNLRGATNNMWIGRQETFSRYYQGNIDELFIENRAWSAQDVRRYYNQSKGRFAAKIS